MTCGVGFAPPLATAGCSHQLPRIQHQQQWKQTYDLVGDTGVPLQSKAAPSEAQGLQCMEPHSPAGCPSQGAFHGCRGTAHLEAQMSRADSQARCRLLGPVSMQALAAPSPGAHFWALPDDSGKHPGICCSCVGMEQSRAPAAESLLRATRPGRVQQPPHPQHCQEPPVIPPPAHTGTARLHRPGPCSTSRLSLACSRTPLGSPSTFNARHSKDLGKSITL